MNVTTDLDIWTLILGASAVVKAVMLLLAVVSFLSWMFIFSKWFGIRRARRQTEQFERELLALRGKPERVLDTANSIQKLGRQPIGEELEGKVRERVAERRYFPVEDRGDARLGRIED